VTGRSAAELCRNDAITLAGLLRGREVSAREVVAAHIEQIEAFDGGVNAVVTRTFETALATAAAADEALARGAEPGLLDGLPDGRGRGDQPGQDQHPRAEFGAGSHTVNPVLGATRNPFDSSRSAGGSSGGAAAALAARMICLADGSDLGGSLRNPASFCNVVGLRPSPGPVPRWPISEVADTLGVEGPTPSAGSS
jgi:amidase